VTLLAAHAAGSSGTPIAFIVMFGVFLVLVLVLGVFVVRFAIALGRRKPPPPRRRPSGREPGPTSR
jgi:hypothetical protein